MDSPSSPITQTISGSVQTWFASQSDVKVRAIAGLALIASGNKLQTLLSELQMNELHVPDVMYQPGGSEDQTSEPCRRPRAAGSPFIGWSGLSSKVRCSLSRTASLSALLS